MRRKHAACCASLAPFAAAVVVAVAGHVVPFVACVKVAGGRDTDA